ncbi:MAG: YceI family protein [Acidobacteria bacterium]|nr:YceI family protein [Acidobacteriota bacterium]
MSQRSIVLGLAALLLPAAAAAQSTVEFTVSGTSTVRSWTCTAQGVIAVTPGAAATPLPGFATGVQAATVTVPLKSFRCPSDEMTQHLNETMKSDKFPEIVYRLDKYDVAGGQAQVTGTMTITGVSQPVTVPVTLTASDKGVQVEGNVRLEFATFSIDPPTVFLGMLKVGPQLRITVKGTIAR